MATSLDGGVRRQAEHAAQHAQAGRGLPGKEKEFVRLGVERRERRHLGSPIQFSSFELTGLARRPLEQLHSVVTLR